jgi:N-acetylmuramoyl-L-alanine amidase
LLVNKWMFFCAILMILITKVTLAASTNSLPLSLDGRSLGSGYATVSETQDKYINVNFLRKFFHVATSWNPSGKELYFKFGKLNYKLYAGNKSYYVNGEKLKFSVAPYETDDQLWIPLEFYLRLGLRVAKSDDRQLALEWSENYLLGIESISYRDRPAFLLTGAQKFQIKHYTLHNPERLVLQLPMKTHFALDDVIAAAQPPVGQIRIKHYRGGLGMLVFDLDKTSGYSIIRDPGQPNQAVLIFNYQIEAVQLSLQNDASKITVKTSMPADYKLEKHPETNSLELIFSGAVYQNEPTVIPGDGNLFRSVRIAPRGDNDVSLMIELAASEECVARRSRKNPLLVEVKRVGEITGATWSQTAKGSDLRIEADSEINETIRTAGLNLKHLRIDLESLQFPAGLETEIPCGGQLKSIIPANSSPHTATLEIDFNSFAAYTVTFSADRRQMTVHFHRSKLAGKTVVLDPGHGGSDPGACGKLDTYEKEVNLAVAIRLKGLLEQAGVNVILTRTGDQFIGLYERAYLANRHRANLFISIHSNSHPNPNIHGIEVFHYPRMKQSNRLAAKILDSLSRSTGLQKLGVKSNNFVVIRETVMPGILVELGFLSNYTEERSLKSAEFRDKAAIGIFNGIIGFF